MPRLAGNLGILRCTTHMGIDMAIRAIKEDKNYAADFRKHYLALVPFTPQEMLALLTLAFPTCEARVRGELRLRVGRMVYAAFYEDDTIMGFGFPKDERGALVASQPEKFLLPRSSQMRYRWVCVRLDAIDRGELRRLLVGAWRLCVPKRLAAACDA